MKARVHGCATLGAFLMGAALWIGTATAAEPIPDSAWGPPIDSSKGYHVEEISDGLYWVTEGIYQAMFLTTGEGVIAVDAPPSIGQNYLKAIAEVTDEPITHVIYSHTHADHIAAAGMFPSDATYIAQEMTADHLRGVKEEKRPIPFGTFVGGSSIPVPTVTFADKFTLKVGSQTLELAYKGPAHEPGNIFIYAPEQKVLMLVDVVFPGWSPFKSLAEAEDTPAYMNAHDQILEYDFDTFIGGHLGRLGSREDVVTQQTYFADVRANAIAALQTVDFNSIAQKLAVNNPWLIFDTYLNAVTDACSEPTVEKWKATLAAADIFTPSHCFRMVMSLRID